MTPKIMRNQPLPNSFSHARNLLGALALSGAMLISSGCLYRMPIQQGNFLNPTQVAQLETGMTRSQVRFLLGTPMVPNGFDGDRWDYYYYVKAGRRWEAATQRLSVWFKDEKVDRIENSDPTPAPTAPAAQAPAPASTDPAPAPAPTP
jgi:outer membrane protein assembly factor BamE